MSIINRILIIPENVQVKIQDFETIGTTNNQVKEQVVEITGPQGRLVQRIFPEVEVTKTENNIFTRLKVGNRELELVGTLNSKLYNCLKGVAEKHQKELVIEGVRNKVLKLKNEELEFSLGASHPIRLVVPSGLEVNFPEKNQIIIKGIDKEKVGQFAAQIRNLRKHSPYKKNGIYYKNEKITLRKKSSKSS